MQTTLHKATCACGLKKDTPHHSLRHRYATHLIKAGGDLIEVRYLHAPIDVTDHHPLFALVKLERLAQLEFHGHKNVRLLAFTIPSIANECGQLAVATRVSVRLDLRVQVLGGASVLFRAVGQL